MGDSGLNLDCSALKKNKVKIKYEIASYINKCFV